MVAVLTIGPWAYSLHCGHLSLPRSLVRGFTENTTGMNAND